MVALVWCNPYSIRTCLKLFQNEREQREAQTRADKDRQKLWVKNRALNKEAWLIYVRNEMTQHTDKWKLVILSYCAVVL